MIANLSEENLEDTKGVIRNRNSTDRKYNGQNKTDKRTNNDLQNTTEKTNDLATMKMEGGTHVLQKNKPFLFLL